MYAAPRGTPNSGARLVIETVTASSHQGEQCAEQDEFHRPGKRYPDYIITHMIAVPPHQRSTDEDPKKDQPRAHENDRTFVGMHGEHGDRHNKEG